jgi:hypothetical protein
MIGFAIGFIAMLLLCMLTTCAVGLIAHLRYTPSCTPSRYEAMTHTRSADRYDGVAYEDLPAPTPLPQRLAAQQTHDTQPTRTQAQPRPMSKREVLAHWRAAAGSETQADEVRRER